MTDRSASKPRDAFGSTSSQTWKDDARRAFDARVGGVKDFVRERRWPVVAAVAFVALSGAGVVANVGGAASERADALEKTVVEREKRVADLDAERKRAEDRLAELQKKLNAKESQIAASEERATALEKRREGLERQVAELVGPVAPDRAERVADGQPDIQTAAAESVDESPDDSDGLAPSMAPAPSTARVDGRQTTELKAADFRTDARKPVREERVRAASRDMEPSDVAHDAVDRPAAGPVRVFIHVRSADPAARERAAAVAAELRRRGVSVAEIRGVRLPVRRDAVRFFYDQDRGAIPELQDAVRSASPSAGAPEVRDFRSFGSPPRRGTIELWLS